MTVDRHVPAADVKARRVVRLMLFGGSGWALAGQGLASVAPVAVVSAAVAVPIAWACRHLAPGDDPGGH